MNKCTRSCELYDGGELFYFQKCIHLHKMGYAKNHALRKEDKKIFWNTDLYEYPTMSKGILINTSICYRNKPKTKRSGRVSKIPRF